MLKTWAIVFAGLFFLAGTDLAGDISIGAKLGLADPEHLDTALDLGGLIRGKLAPNWRLEGSLEYWGVSNVRDVSINGAAAYEVPVSGTVHPYLGFGTGVHFQTWEGSWAWWNGHDWVNEDHTETNLGLHFLGGADFDISHQTKIITEIKYALVPNESGINALTLTGGVAFKLK